MMGKTDIAKLLAAGGKRWSRGSMDRIYIDATALGLKIERYKIGNVSSATWQGESISNADARRLLRSKVYVDCADGSLHVDTSFYDTYNESMRLENVAEKFVKDALEAEEAQADVIMIAESLEAAYDAMANEAVVHRGETAYLSGLLYSFDKRFGLNIYEVGEAIVPRLAKLRNN
jgi:hypothetical protein